MKTTHRYFDLSYFQPVVLGLGCAFSILYNSFIYEVDPNLITLLFLIGICGTHLVYSIPILCFNGQINQTITWKGVGRQRLRVLAVDIIILGCCFCIVELQVKLLLLSELGICLLYFFGTKTVKFSTQRLRNIPFLKCFIIPFIWSLALVFMPMLAGNRTLDSFYLMEFIRHLFFIAGIAIIFDIEDSKIDAETKLKSIPIVVGIEASRHLSIVSLLIYCSITYYQFDVGNVFWASLISCSIAVYYALTKQPFSEKSYSANLLDGILILQPAFYFFLMTVSN